MWSEKNVEHSGTCVRVFTCFCCSEEGNIWRKLLVDAMWQWVRVVVSVSMCMCGIVVNAQMTVAIRGLKFISVCQNDSNKQFWVTKLYG